MTLSFLRKCSITYLALPSMLFAGGWFRGPYSVLLLIGFSFMLYNEYRKNEESPKISNKDTAVILISAGLIVFFSGIDGYTTQSFDWLAHNSKFYDLYKNNWPIYFEEVEQHACYYFGYYLVPSFVSKLAGNLLPGVLVFWTFTGFFLGLAWIYVLLEKNAILLFLFFFLRGTGQLLIQIINRTTITKLAKPPVFNPSMRSLLEHSTFTPNQVIPVLIGCGILLYDFIERKKIDETFFIITLLFVWGVFPAISLLVIFGLLAFQKYFFSDGFRQITKSGSIVHYIIPGLLFLPTFIYFSGSQGSIIKGFLWQFEPARAIVIGYLTGVFVDILLLYLLVFSLNKGDEKLPLWFINGLFAGLLLLSVYRTGIFNDSFFRGSTPFLVIILVLILRAMAHRMQDRQWPTFRPFYAVALLMLCLSAVQLFIKLPLLRDNVVANSFLGKRKSFRGQGYDLYPNTYQMLLYGYHDKNGAQQYLASKNSFYVRYLSKQPEMAGKAEIE